jgi:hypothetical protein
MTAPTSEAVLPLPLRFPAAAAALDGKLAPSRSWLVTGDKRDSNRGAAARGFSPSYKGCHATLPQGQEQTGTGQETRSRHPQHDAVARYCLPHCVAGSSDGNLVPHERGALLEDCLIVLRVGLTDESTWRSTEASLR